MASKWCDQRRVVLSLSSFGPDEEGSEDFGRAFAGGGGAEGGLAAMCSLIAEKIEKTWYSARGLQVSYEL